MLNGKLSNFEQFRDHLAIHTNYIKNGLKFEYVALEVSRLDSSSEI